MRDNVKIQILLRLLYSIILLCLICHNSRAQESISLKGIIINDKDKSPLAGATLYLSNTTIGTTTSEDGTFVLKNIPPGDYYLVASYLGYKTLSLAVSKQDDGKVISMALQPDINRLKEIIIRSKRLRNGDRQRYLGYFKEGFIGTDSNAEHCKILNPYALYYMFDKKSAMLTVHAKEPLIIENKALGYSIYYELDSFFFDLRNYHTSYFGYPRFDALTPRNKTQQERWDHNRLSTYQASKRRFMLLLANRQLEQHHIEMNKLIRTGQKEAGIQSSSVSFNSSFNPLEGLGAHARDSLFPRQAPYDSVIYNGARHGYVKLKFSNSLRIRIPQSSLPKHGMTVIALSDRTKNKPSRPTHRPTTISIITMRKPETYIDPNGVLADPLAVSVEGDWAYMQVADLLPFDYRPPK